MTEHDTLIETVQNLVERGTEGTYWEFKLQHHENRADLIHDVLCMANADHEGDRFLIFGVEDSKSAVHSIDNTPNRRRQADVAGLFRDNSTKFFQSRIPDFHLRELDYAGNLLDVLVIEDKPHKPYYLVEDYKHGRRTVCAHHIYTRVGATNTPPHDAAAPHEIERMWRERFGLDMPPLERAKRYLYDPGKWLPVSERAFSGDEIYYYTTFPEFTLRFEGRDSPWHTGTEEWARGEIATGGTLTCHVNLNYHQTLLHRARYVSFDDGRKSMIAPQREPRGAGRFYFYRADSVDYALQRFFSKLFGDDHSKSLRVGGESELSKQARAQWPDGMVIPVVRTGELDQFLGLRDTKVVMSSSGNETEPYEVFLRNQLDFENRSISD